MPDAESKAGYLRIRSLKSGPAYYACWKARKPNGRWVEVPRAIGPAWVVADGAGGWQRRPGRAETGYFDEGDAWQALERIRTAWEGDQAATAAAAAAAATLGPTLREAKDEWLVFLRDVKKITPATATDYAYMLAEPGTPHRRGKRVSVGRIMLYLGDARLGEITPEDIDELLDYLQDEGLQARTINKYRVVISALFNWSRKHWRKIDFSNPVEKTHARRERRAKALVYFEPEHVEAIARAAAAGAHRDVSALVYGVDERDARRREDEQDAEMFRTAAYLGWRLGEQIAARWGDINWAQRSITIRRVVSAGELVDETKGKSDRTIPMPDQAAAALERLSRRGEFIEPDDYIFCNRFGEHLHGTGVRRRYRAARDKAKMPDLRYHDLRHSYGSILASRGIDLVTIQGAMGHAHLATTQRYLHARPAHVLADAFTSAFTPNVPDVAPARSISGVDQ